MTLNNIVLGGDSPERLLLLVHGLGADERDLAGVVPYLDPDARFLTVLPQGPYQAPPGYAWFSFGAGDNGFPESLAALDELVDAACAEYGLARNQAVIAGFSQGAGMALALGYGPSASVRPAGVLAMSGFQPRGVDLAADEGVTYPAALVQHGRLDPVVPPVRGNLVAELLAERGVPTVFREYPMQHELTLESLADARAWLEKIVDGDRPT